MAITAVDGIVAGFQPPQLYMKAIGASTTIGKPYSPFYLNGIPGPGSAPSSGLSGSAHTAPLNGCIPFVDGSGVNRHLGRFVMQASGVGGAGWLIDRLWSNSGITVTSTASQTINSAAFPARDVNDSANGEGVMVAVEVSAQMGAGTPTITMSYTNSDGVAGRTATLLTAAIASAPIGTFLPFALQAGDKGVRSIQSIQQSATWTSGTYHLVAYRIVQMVGLPAAGYPGAVDSLNGGLAKMSAGSCLHPVFLPAGSSSTPYITAHFIQTNG